MVACVTDWRRTDWRMEASATASQALAGSHPLQFVDIGAAAVAVAIVAGRASPQVPWQRRRAPLQALVSLSRRREPADLVHPTPCERIDAACEAAGHEARPGI